VIPVLNEEENINSFLDSLYTIPNANIKEIIVVDGAPSCNTLKAIIRDDIIKVSSKKGRGPQMNKGADRATGDLLIFLHADTYLPHDALIAIENTLEDQKIVGGAFSLRFDSKTLIIRVVGWIHTKRAHITKVLYGDQAIFLRRNYFEKIGGYDDIPLMEDVEITKRIKKRGDKLVVLPQEVITSARRLRQDGILLIAFRFLALILFFSFGILPKCLVRMYKK
jgi:rSAM/selenodomain-associated transferase 2